MITDDQMDQLEKLKELLDNDILSQEEFEEKKALILNESKNEEAAEITENKVEGNEQKDTPSIQNDNTVESNTVVMSMPDMQETDSVVKKKKHLSKKTIIIIGILN